jgi:hypothetical protein
VLLSSNRWRSASLGGRPYDLFGDAGPPVEVQGGKLLRRVLAGVLPPDVGDRQVSRWRPAESTSGAARSLPVEGARQGHGAPQGLVAQVGGGQRLALVGQSEVEAHRDGVGALRLNPCGTLFRPPAPKRAPTALDWHSLRSEESAPRTTLTWLRLEGAGRRGKKARKLRKVPFSRSGGGRWEKGQG